MKRKLHHYSFIRKYRHVYIFISVLVVSGFLVGCYGSRFIESSDIETLSSLLTTIPENVEAYGYFINQFFLGIVLIVVFYSVPVLPGYRSLVLSYFQKVFRLVFHVPCLFVLISSRGFWEFF